MDKTPRFSGPIDCLTQTWQKEGLRGLYRVCSSSHAFDMHLLIHPEFLGSPRPYRRCYGGECISLLRI